MFTNAGGVLHINPSEDTANFAEFACGAADPCGLGFGNNVSSWQLGGVSTLTGTSAPAPAALLQTLHSNVTGFGPGKILEKTVAQAQVYYAVPDIQATCAVMRFFDYEVRVIWKLSKATRKAAPWKITMAQMDDWLGQSGSIQIALDCN